MSSPPQDPRRRARRTRAAGAFAVAMLPLALGAACGKKASPKPPQWVIPGSPAPVTVASAPEGLKVSWRRPKTYADGSSLDDLGAFSVSRACDGSSDFVPIAHLPVTDRERFRKGQTFSIVDPGVASDASCRYRVVAVTLDDYRSPPAESGLPGEPPPAPPEPAPTATPAVRSDRFTDPGEEPGEAPLPAPLVSPTPYPPLP